MKGGDLFKVLVGEFKKRDTNNSHLFVVYNLILDLMTLSNIAGLKFKK